MASIAWLDENIPSRKRAKVTYDVRTVDGQRKRKSKTFKPKTPYRDIRAFIREVEAEYDKGEALDYTKRTVEEFLEEFFDDWATTTNLSPSTLRSYKQHAYGIHGVVEFMGKVRLDKLSQSTVQKYVNYLVSEGLSPKTIRNHRGFIHVFYHRALRLRYVTGVNVADDIEIPKQQKSQPKAYTEEEVKKLFEIVDRDACDRMRLQVYLAVHTGMRRSEMAGLKFSAVDFDNHVVRVEHSRISLGGTADDVEKQPKTDAGIREIPMSGTIERMLRKARKTYNENKLRMGRDFHDDGYVFSREDGTPYKTDTFSGSYRAFMLRHQDEIQYYSLHALRRTFASLQVKSGIDVKALQEMMGHADISTTLGIYSRSYDDVKREHIDKLDGILRRDAAGM